MKLGAVAVIALALLAVLGGSNGFIPPPPVEGSPGTSSVPTVQPSSPVTAEGNDRATDPTAVVTTSAANESLPPATGHPNADVAPVPPTDPAPTISLGTMPDHGLGVDSTLPKKKPTASTNPPTPKAPRPKHGDCGGFQTVVRAGEGWSAVAKRNKVNVNALAAANNTTVDGALWPDDVLCLPSPVQPQATNPAPTTAPRATTTTVPRRTTTTTQPRRTTTTTAPRRTTTTQPPATQPPAPPTTKPHAPLITRPQPPVTVPPTTVPCQVC